MPSSAAVVPRHSRRVRCAALRGCTILALATACTLPAVLATPAIAAAQAPSAEAPSSEDPDPTLYERLGGFDFIAGFVDLAFPRVASHPELTRHFGGHSVDTQFRQRQLVVELLCQRAGGPCVYIGRPLPTAHEGLGITPEDWEIFMDIIHTASDELAVPADVRDDWIALWEGFRAASVLE